MLAKGNGTPAQCAANLVKTTRREVPYERTKGINRGIIDTPSTAAARVTADVEHTVKVYEPRLGSFSVKLDPVDGLQGQYGIRLVVE